MSLSATRSRRSNAGNRWAEALAAAQLENGDAPDPDAEAPGEEFIGKEELDVFESDFESTDEEEYAKQGIEDGEKQVQMEEKAERRAARAKASKIGSAPAQRILERAMRGQPAPKKKQSSTKNILEHKFSSLWDATRQSERASTVKHKFQVQERLKDAEKRKAHAPKRPRPIAPTKTQDELIAAALELEEKNTKALREFLQKEEEKRAAARKVVRLKIEGPVVRWVSRGEVPLVEEVKEERGTRQTSAVASQAQVQIPPVQAPVSQTSATPAPAAVEVPPSPIGPDPSSTSISTSTVARSSTPSRTQRMQVYVEIPTPSKSIRRSLSARSQSPLTSRGLSVPSTQPLVRSPLSSTVSLPRSPLNASEPLVPESGPFQSSGQPQWSESSQPPGPTSSYSSEPASQHQGPRSIPSQSNVIRTSHRPTAIRQSSVSSSGSGKSKGKMIMYVEIPMRKRDKGKTLVPGSIESPRPSGLLLESSSVPAIVSNNVAVPTPTPTPATSTSVFSSPSVPTLPTSAPTYGSLSQKQTRNYVIVEYGGGARASFGWNMQAVFGKHADWEDVLINGVKAPHPVKPTCPITGLSAPYRDSRTGIPYANAYAYKTLTRLLAHEFVWSKERGCYIGDEGRDPARSVPTGWRSAATGQF